MSGTKTFGPAQNFFWTCRRMRHLLTLLTKFQNIWYHFKIGNKISSQLFFLPLCPTFFVNKVSHNKDKCHPLWNHWNAFAIFRIVLSQKWVQYILVLRLCTVWQFHNLMSYQLSFDYATFFCNEFNRSIHNIHKYDTQTHKILRLSVV